MTAKKRALEYIRTKNKLRNGDTISQTFTVPEFFLDDESTFLTVFQPEIDNLKKFKLNLKHEISKGYVNRDFLDDTITIKIKSSIL